MIAKRLVFVSLLILLALAALAAIAGCGLNVVSSDELLSDAASGGIDDAVGTPDGFNQDGDGTKPIDNGDAEPIVDGGGDDDGGTSADVVVPKDGGDAGAPSCPDASTTFSGGTLTVPKATSAVTIDGLLDDWKCAHFFTFDAGTAAQIDAVVPGANVYSFAVAWDSAYVYVAAEVADSTVPRGAATADQNYKNDSIEAYVAGDTTFTTNYTSKDHQYVVDFANRAYVYNGNLANTVPSAAFASAAKSTNTGYVIEMRIPAADLGRASFASGAQLGFAFAANENNGANQHGWLLWYRPNPACTSPACCSVWCNALYFHPLILK